jgi:hypothetical protein
MCIVRSITVASGGLLGLLWSAFQRRGGVRCLARRIVAGMAVLSCTGFAATAVLPSPAWITIGSAILASVVGIQVVQSMIFSFFLQRMDDESLRVARLMTLDGASPLWDTDSQCREEHRTQSANRSHPTEGGDR